MATLLKTTREIEIEKNIGEIEMEKPHFHLKKKTP